MKSPILFLDIDGVLNSETTNFGPHEPPLDPVNIEPFNRIVSSVKPRIVITSTWRFYWSLESIRSCFEEVGICGEIAEATPVLSHPEMDDPPIEIEITRGEEIFAWFRDESVLDPHSPECRFAILDDRTDQEPYLDRLVQTSMSRGLTDSEADRVIEMLQ